jgi:ABC-type branched-subunit amino acid transport system permease subunit
MSVPAPRIGGFRLIGTDRVFWLVAVCMVLTVLVVRNLGRTRTGRAWNAVRDDEIAASSMGVNLRREKLKAFAFAAFLAGISGVLYSYTIRYVETSYFELMGLSLFLILVVGGIGRIYGPVLGALFITLLPQMIGGVFNQHMSLVFGTVLVLFILLAPRGFYGLIDIIRGRMPAGLSAREALFPARPPAAADEEDEQ